MRKIVAGKLHGIHVTEANLDYHGSITLDPDHCEAAGLLPMEFVEIWNKNSGARISTYVIPGERGSRCCILNGAAARTCQPGDPLIICNSVYVEEAAADQDQTAGFDLQQEQSRHRAADLFCGAQ
ncbi:aspartate 1-decarboxylase [Mesorhizobium delmotii]|uniref:Aspartate 1-decarboxylase n=1 Tax=Mesorhizobium delmotii TaxID=1631247 RepID=A0A2P9AGB9_9HYPH|nr:aspartate 1-decarboxylase [Mesorhizobium delmotii]